MSDTSINPVKITQIEILYENGVRIVIPESKSAKVGTAFFKLIKDDNIDFKIIEPGEQSKKLKKKLSEFWKL